jgi:hypothetical protein
MRTHLFNARLWPIAALVWICAAGTSAAQTRPSTLATLFEDIYGPDGLIVNSDDVLLDGRTHSAHFNSAFQSDFRLFNIALTSQLAAVPLPSPASGFTYEFNPATGTFVRSARSFGPILTDRAETIGRGRLAFGFNYQYFSYDRLDGVELASVPAVFTHDGFELGGGRTDVVSTTNTIVATVAQSSAALTYGLTDRLDLSLAVPVIHTRLSLLSNARIFRVGTGDVTDIHYFEDPNAFGGFGSTRQFYSEASAGGIGDLVVRAKGTILRERARALAVGVNARLPTGDEENLLGAGALGVEPFAAFSTAFGPAAPHINVAYQWNGDSLLAGEVREGTKGNLPDQFSYAVGTDVSVTDKFSVVVDLIGRRIIDSPRLFERNFAAMGPAGAVTLPDLTFERLSYWTSTGAVGFKLNVAAQLLVAFNLRFSLTDAGLTDRVAPLLGFEYSF